MEIKPTEREPLVSIIIPVFNGSDYMREAIDSALAQTYCNTEVIVVNDGSSDDGKTDEIARLYGDRIRYLKKENGGVSSALNVGINNMHGEYFSWLSHDDMYLPEKIEHQIEHLRKESFDKKTIAMCCADFIDENSQIIRDTKSSTKKTGTISWESALCRLIDDGCFNGCTLLIPKKTFDLCGSFDEELRYIQDFWMWMIIFSKKHRLLCSVDVDVHSRVHKKQLTKTGRKLFLDESRMIGEKIIPLLTDLSDNNNNFFFILTLLFL